MMNRIDPVLFAACFMDWVVACWPEPLDAIAIDGKTVRRSHDRAKGRAALHLASAFATNSRLVLGQEAVDDKSNETTAIPVLLEKLAAGRSLEGAVVTIDAIACNPQIAQCIRASGRTICSPSKAISRPCKPTSRPPSKPPTRARLKSMSMSTRATAASKPEPSRSCAMSTGSTVTDASPANSASPTRPLIEAGRCRPVIDSVFAPSGCSGAQAIGERSPYRQDRAEDVIARAGLKSAGRPLIFTFARRIGSVGRIATLTPTPHNLPVQTGRKSQVDLRSIDLLSRIIVKSLEDAKAEGIVTIEIAGKTTLADRMIIASGRSSTHVGAIADQVLKACRDAGFPAPKVEGLPLCDWVLLDARDAIVHIFRPDIRQFYNLEKMWSSDRPGEDRKI